VALPAQWTVPFARRLHDVNTIGRQFDRATTSDDLRYDRRPARVWAAAL